ncbi:unnamed protein product [Symbiodinium sp. CCMP2592]|nr:unnamed protein product [Symbiodinium sp. CCMP2592]
MASGSSLTAAPNRARAEGSPQEPSYFCRLCAMGGEGKHLPHECRDPRCRCYGIPPRKRRKDAPKEAAEEGEVQEPPRVKAKPQPAHQRGQAAPKAALPRGEEAPSGEQEATVAAMSSSEESSSSETSASTDSDPLRGTHPQRRSTRRLVEQLYAEAWKGEVVYHGGTKSFYMFGEAPSSNVRVLSEGQRRGILERMADQAYNCIMTAKLYGGRRTLSHVMESLEQRPLKVGGLWTGLQLRHHEELRVDAAKWKTLVGAFDQTPTESQAGEEVTAGDLHPREAADMGEQAPVTPPLPPGGEEEEAIHADVSDWTGAESDLDSGGGQADGTAAPQTPEIQATEDDLRTGGTSRPQWPDDDAVDAAFGDLTEDQLRAAWHMEAPRGSTEPGESSAGTAAPLLNDADFLQRVLQDLDEEAGEVAVETEEFDLESANAAVYAAGRQPRVVKIASDSTSHQAKELKVKFPRRAKGRASASQSRTAGEPATPSSLTQQVLRLAREGDNAETEERGSPRPTATTRTFPAGGKPERSPLKRKPRRPER